MKQLLFTARGRINRAAFWKGFVIILAVTGLAGILIYAYGSLLPNEADADGEFKVTGVASIPLVIAVLAILAFNVVAGLCIAIKRLHDRNKSGWWFLIQLIPFIGSIWYFLEVGVFAGTAGANRFGPDPLEKIQTP